MKIPLAFKRIRRSTFLWIVVCLVFADWSLESFKPLRFVEIGGYIPADQNPLFEKFATLTSHRSGDDILLLGSSLPLYAATLSDLRSGEPAPSRIDYTSHAYTHARYLEHLLQEHLGRSVSVFNFTGVGCMISDAHKILSEVSVRGVRPTVAILAIAPRDFIDHTACQTGKTAYYDFFDKELPARGFAASTASPSIRPPDLAALWHFFKVRSDYYTLITQGVNAALHRAPTLFVATRTRDTTNPVVAATPVKFTWITPAEEADVVWPENQKIANLKQYAERYSPIDWERYSVELTHLMQSLVLCNRNSIIPVVVEMPISAKNLALLPAEFKKRYSADIAAACKQSGATQIDLTESTAFQDSDFRDSVHLNGGGGKKLWEFVATQLSSTPNIAAAISNHRIATNQARTE